MNRRGAKFLFFTTLTLLAASVSLWLISHVYPTMTLLFSGPRMWGFADLNGHLYFFNGTCNPSQRNPDMLFQRITDPSNTGLGPPPRLLPGISLQGAGGLFQFSLHLYWPTLLFTLATAYQYHRLYRQKPTPHLCPTCNYDLRATPTQCPECGTLTGGTP